MVVVVDSLKNPGCSICSMRWVDDIPSVVVSTGSSTVTSSVPSSASSSSTTVVVAMKSVTVELADGRTVTVAAAAVAAVAAVAVVVDAVLDVVVLVLVLVVLTEPFVGDGGDDGDDGGGGGCDGGEDGGGCCDGCDGGPYRFNDDSSLRLFQVPPSMSLVSIMERNTDMCRCSPYMRFIRPWFSKTNRRTACLDMNTKYE